MRGEGNRNQQEEEDYEEEGPSSFATTNNSNSNNTQTTTGKDGKSIDKVNAMRSKHSVTEQRRRSKINERFQILRDLIPHSDQKRDTASFLLEVIEYVQYLQEKVHKYEGQYPGWSPEPTKLMPWRNSHWRSQSFVGNIQAMKNGSGPGSTFHEHNSTITPTILPSAQNPLESDPNRDITGKSMEQQSELVNRGMPQSTCLQNFVTNPLQQPVSDAQSAEYTTTHEPLIQPEELTIEGGTISISSTYSEGLLNTLTQALQTAGVDLSQANISVQIDIGNRVNRGLTCIASTAKDSQNQSVTHLRDHSSGEESDPAQKRLKT